MLNKIGRPKKRFSQNFLIDEKVLEREVNYANISNSNVVLEIGAGFGSLTKFLVKKASKVIAIEKDPKFENFLKKTGADIIIADALEIDFPEFDKIVSNIPYSISSDLTFKILNYNFDCAVLCYQKEFSQRMLANPGEKDYSRLSVNCSLRAEIELLENVPKEKFYPKPKVDSSIVRLIPKKIELPKKFSSIVRALFQHRNQKVRNALTHSAHEIGTKAEVKSFLGEISNFSDKKVFELTPEEILEISKLY